MALVDARLGQLDGLRRLGAASPRQAVLIEPNRGGVASRLRVDADPPSVGGRGGAHVLCEEDCDRGCAGARSDLAPPVGVARCLDADRPANVGGLKARVVVDTGDCGRCDRYVARRGRARHRCGRGIDGQVRPVLEVNDGVRPGGVRCPCDLGRRVRWVRDVEHVSGLRELQVRYLGRCVRCHHLDRRARNDLCPVLVHTEIQVPELQDVCLGRRELEVNQARDGARRLGVGHVDRARATRDGALDQRHIVEACLQSAAVLVKVSAAIQQRGDFADAEEVLDGGYFWH